ncbi:hypothetical protein AVEN_227384-1 [Araneus ventricosus]|uniref:Uncharacterized protein n=1 Tax=Araneus ventricosus TaxID=182803 RepID=A0A4Y2GUT7_ARAVE|nr:hypothetical protein AVEN_227384-1 [Araneus ventricosus]
MQSGQERLEKEFLSGQEEMKIQIQAHTESQGEEIKIHVDGCIGKIEEEVQCVKLKIEEFENEVQRKIEEVEEKVQGKIGDIERRLSELGDRPFSFSASQAFMHHRPTIKSLTFDGQTVAESNQDSDFDSDHHAADIRRAYLVIIVNQLVAT